MIQYGDTVVMMMMTEREGERKEMVKCKNNNNKNEWIFSLLRRFLRGFGITSRMSSNDVGFG